MDLFLDGKDKKSISSVVIEELGVKPRSTSELIDLFHEKYKFTKQGFYRVLRKLIKMEIIVKHKQMVSLNSAWLTKLEKFLKTKVKDRSISVGHQMIPEKGEQISRSFRTTSALDIYLGHIFLLLAEQLQNEPIFAYNSHEWFIYDRPESEQNLFDWITENKRNFYLTLGKDSPLARKFKRDMQNKNTQIAIGDFGFSVEKNIIVIGPYVIFGLYDKMMSEKIDKLFLAAQNFREEEKIKLQNILKNHKKSKIVVKHNEKLANQLKKRFSKNFYIKQ